MEQFDFFNLDIADFKTAEKTTNNTKFKPTSENGTNGIYKAQVRFLPWYKNTKNSLINKWQVWLTDIQSGTSKTVDCPTSVGKPSVLKDTYWKYKNSQNAHDQKFAEMFSRKQKFASLVQIIEDKHNPDNEGKIMIWEFGLKVHAKIMEQLAPEFGDACNVYDLLNGKNFGVLVSKVGGYNNYDACKFLDTVTPISINGKKMTNNDGGLIKEYLESSPDLSKLEYQDWDQETEDFVKKVIQNCQNPSEKIEHIKSANQNQKAANTSVEAVSMQNLDLENDIFDNL
jgi:hypothetical protein